MELRDLVELLYTAHNRFSTIQVTWQYHYDEKVMRTVQDRWAALHSPDSVAALKTDSQPYERKPQNTVRHVHRRVWWKKPDCWREEQQLDGYAKSIAMLCNDEWWALGSRGDILYTNVKDRERWSRFGVQDVREGNPPDLEDCIRGVPLLDPSFLLISHDLVPLGDTVHAGREAVQVRATYLKGKSQLHEAFFWATAEEYELLVDKTYGVLLRYAAKVDGRVFAVSSVEQIEIDRPISQDVFTLAPSSER